MSNSTRTAALNNLEQIAFQRRAEVAWNAAAVIGVALAYALADSAPDKPLKGDPDNDPRDLRPNQAVAPRRESRAAAWRR